MNYNLFKSFLSDHWMKANLKIPNLKAEGCGLLGRVLFTQAGRSELGSQAPKQMPGEHVANLSSQLPGGGRGIPVQVN